MLFCSLLVLAESKGTLRLLMHCTSPESSAILGKRRNSRQLIHRGVKRELVQCSGWVVVIASQESVVGARQAREHLKTPRGETAGPAGRQRLRVGIVARSDKVYGGNAFALARGDRQHAAG